MPTFLTLLETHEEISFPLICASALACLFLQFAARFASEALLQRLRAQGLSFKDEWEWTNR
jgi:hypothetical protein